MVDTNEQLGEQIKNPITPKWTEKYLNAKGKPYKTTKGYIDNLKKTGKVGGEGYQKWVEEGRPMYSEKVGYRYEDWQ